MAGAFGTTFANAFALLLFQATAIANVADNAASSPITNIQYALHTAAPASGSQSSNEATYGSYARQAVARTSGGHTVSSNTVAFAATLSFPISTGTPSEVLSHFSAGRDASSTGMVFFWGTLTPTITMNASGITPQITTAVWLTLGV